MNIENIKKQLLALDADYYNIALLYPDQYKLYFDYDEPVVINEILNPQLLSELFKLNELLPDKNLYSLCLEIDLGMMSYEAVIKTEYN
jgi:hypothetical protein